MTDLPDLETLDDGELERLNMRLSADREEIRQAQQAIADEQTRRAAAERERRAALAEAQSRHPHEQSLEPGEVESAEAFDGSE